jgi:hypothetical protein
MSDRFCSHLCCSKYPGRRVSISGMDDINVKSTNAVRYAGDRIFCRLAIDLAERQKKSGKMKAKVEKKHLYGKGMKHERKK